MLGPDDTIPTSWPDNVAITSGTALLPDAPADWPDVWRVAYHGECFHDGKTTDGSLGDVIVWAQDHYDPPPSSGGEPVEGEPPTEVQNP